MAVSAPITSLALALLEGEADLWAGRGGDLGIGVVAVSAAVTSLALSLLELVADAGRAAVIRATTGVSTVTEAATVSTFTLASLECVASTSSSTVGREVGESSAITAFFDKTNVKNIEVRN